MTHFDDQGFRRIVAALWSRVHLIFESPKVGELVFLRLTGNHGEFREKLRQLGLVAESNTLERNILHICLCWMRLALDHFDDARSSLAAGRRRSTFSRSYYAVYNASKSVRYLVTGSVS